MAYFSKITLGTAQLGVKYGIANIIGKPNYRSAVKILDFSWNNGINIFDTAPRYGNSEDIIGSFISAKLNEKSKKIFVMTKLPPIKLKYDLSFDNIYNFIKSQILQSLNRIKINTIPFYLMHNPSDIFLKDGLAIECLLQLKNEGLIEKFGISAYNSIEVEESLNFKEIEVIQLPMNIFDLRFIENGLLKRLSRKKYIIFARSIFLQGLFFLSPEHLPNYLNPAKEYLIKLRALSKSYEISIAKLAFLFVRDIPEITSMIIGTEKIDQIAENISFLEEKPLSVELVSTIIENFRDIPKDIINPSLWTK